MSAPYLVSVSTPDGRERTIPARTLDAAMEAALAEGLKAGPRDVRVLGDGYDVDCDGEGYFLAWDGLTDDERDAVEARGLS